MASAVIKNLREALARIEAERDRLTAQVDAFRLVLTYYEQTEGTEDERPPSVAVKALSNDMWRTLQDIGRAIHYRELTEEMLRRGIAIPGQDPFKNVSAHLSNDPRFERIGKGVWGLRSWRSRQGRILADVTSQSDDAEAVEGAPDDDEDQEAESPNWVRAMRSG